MLGLVLCLLIGCVSRVDTSYMPTIGPAKIQFFYDAKKNTSLSMPKSKGSTRIPLQAPLQGNVMEVVLKNKTINWWLMHVVKLTIRHNIHYI